MALVARLKGAIVVQDGSRYFLVGDRKEPINFPAHGFQAIAERDVIQQPVLALEVIGPVSLEKPMLRMDAEVETLLPKLVQQFIIRRNGSVSERLWGLVAEYSQPLADQEDTLDARWLAEMPEEVWDIVRDSVLRC